ADAMLPVQLAPLAIVTTAEPNFSIGTLRAVPKEIVEAGEEIEFVLHLRNSGDGPARRARLSADRSDLLIYVPNSTSVNDVPVRDVGAQSPLMNERGLVMSDVDPGVEATVRWREVVNNGVGSGAAIVRAVAIAYDSERIDTIAAGEVKVRCAPAFANTIAGLPFGLDGMPGPSLGRTQRALTGSEFIELPPATPVLRPELAPRPVLSLTASNGNGNGSVSRRQERRDEPAAGVDVLTAFDRDRLDRTLRFLSDARFNGLITHAFAVRSFFPDAVGGPTEAALRDVRETMRESLDRIYIKLRLPNYVLAPRDVETKAARAALETLLGSAQADAAVERAGSVLLHGTVDPRELHALRDRLADAPLATALPWAILSRLMPSGSETLAHYRTMLVAAFDDLADADETAFIDALQRRGYPLLDAALDIVRAQLSLADA
ncbi:MAG: hypothetical protein ABR508_04675, partial [Candidatus Baltobacteraceae bacterium]